MVKFTAAFTNRDRRYIESGVSDSILCPRLARWSGAPTLSFAGWQRWLGSGREDVRDTILSTTECPVPGADGRNSMEKQLVNA